MSTLSIQLSGSSISGLTGTPTKAYTVSDADLQSLLTWATKQWSGVLGPSPTNTQILLAWLQYQLVQPTIAGVQATNHVIPPPISMS